MAVKCIAKKGLDVHSSSHGFDRFGKQSKYNLQNYVLGVVLESDLSAFTMQHFLKIP